MVEEAASERMISPPPTVAPALMAARNGWGSLMFILFFSETFYQTLGRLQLLYHGKKLFEN